MPGCTVTLEPLHEPLHDHGITASLHEPAPGQELQLHVKMQLPTCQKLRCAHCRRSMALTCRGGLTGCLSRPWSKVRVKWAPQTSSRIHPRAKLRVELESVQQAVHSLQARYSRIHMLCLFHLGFVQKGPCIDHACISRCQGRSA